MMTATLVTDWPNGGPDGSICHKLYRCERGGGFPEFVIVSSSAHVAGREVRIFASDRDGKISNFSEWLWHEDDTLDHELAMRAAGYETRATPA
jgi:hypothetical protein